jgi:hypothetical protein
VFLMPLADGSFVPGTNDHGLMKESVPVVPYRIDGASLSMEDGATAPAFARVPSLQLGEAALARFAGRYENGIAMALKDGVLSLVFPGQPPAPLAAISPSRFMADGGATLIEFTSKDGRVVSFSAGGGDFTAARLPDR